MSYHLMRLLRGTSHPAAHPAAEPFGAAKAAADELPAVTRLRHPGAHHARLQKVMAIVAAAGVLGFLAVVYLPSTHRLVALELELRNGLSQLTHDRGRARQLPQVEADVATLERRLARFKPIPQSPGLGQFLREVTSHGTRLGLRDFRYAPLAEADAGGGCRITPVTLTFRAGYTEAFAFLRHTEQLPRLLRVAELSVRSDATSPESRAAGLVEVAMTVHLFSRPDGPPQPRAAGAEVGRPPDEFDAYDAPPATAQRPGDARSGEGRARYPKSEEGA